jgi:hypothetical protein
MPTLADIYSALNTFKRKSSDFVQNPGTSLEQMLFAANENAREFNKKHALATDYTIAQARGQQPTPEQTQAEMGLRNTLSEAYTPGMIVYHGSPHVFERFDLGKIGTGEGAQAYGSGMYMAQAPEIAEGYKKTLAHKNYASIVQNDRNNYSVIAKDGSKIAENVMLGQAHKAKDAFDASQTGSFYKVDLPDTHIRRMLDWDSPIKDQPTPVRKLAKILGLDMNDLGGDLLAKVGKDEAGRKVLQDAGIRGIKYLDQTSRNAGGWHITPPDQTVSGKWMVKSADYNSKGLQFDTQEEAKKALKEQTSKATRNFVVFDPSHMTILERNQQTINK